MTQNSARIHCLVISGVLSVHVGISSALAGQINSTPAPIASGPGLGFVSIAAITTATPNNDDVPGTQPDNNIVIPFKRFGSASYIDIPFTVSATQGVTEYLVNEFVDNNTGTNWNSYTMMLGFGTGANFTQVGGLGDGLDFDAGPPGGNTTPPTSIVLPTLTRPNEDTLVFSGGIHGSGAQQYQFRIDVSDLVNRSSTFTLRQQATPIPEPTTIALIGLSFIGLMPNRGLSRRY
jgi:hypothetical protein